MTAVAVHDRLVVLRSSALQVHGVERWLTAEARAREPEHLAAVADAVPDAFALVLPQAAHLASWEQAVAVNAAVLTHLSAAGSAPDPAGGDGESGSTHRPGALGLTWSGPRGRSPFFAQNLRKRTVVSTDMSLV